MYVANYKLQSVCIHTSYLWVQYIRKYVLRSIAYVHNYVATYQQKLYKVCNIYIIYVYIYIYTYIYIIYIFNSYTMGTSGLPDIYT